MTTTVANPSDLIPFGQAGLPAFLQGSSYHSSLDEQQTAVSVDRITQGDGGIVVEKAGIKSNPMLSIDVVIIDATPKGRDTYRAYYEGTWKEGEATAPTCYSADGRVPSANSEKPQCATCQDCPMNVSGSGPNGEGRACGYFKHVAVATYPDLDHVYRLKVSARSLFSKEQNGVPSPLGGNAWGFSKYAQLLQQMRTPWEAVVTRVSLPKGQTYGFFFTPMGYLSEDQFKQVVALREDPTIADVLTVEASASAERTQNNPLAGALPPPPATQPVVEGRAKWLASTTLPQNVKDWIAQVDDDTARNYLTTSYPQEV